MCGDHLPKQFATIVAVSSHVKHMLVSLVAMLPMHTFTTITCYSHACTHHHSHPQVMWRSILTCCYTHTFRHFRHMLFTCIYSCNPSPTGCLVSPLIMFMLVCSTGVEPGTVVVTNKSFNAFLKEEHEVVRASENR